MKTVLAIDPRYFPIKMRLTAQQVIDLERLADGRCPIHVRHNAGCSICVRISDDDKNLTTRDQGVELESELQDQIENYCRNKLWPFVRCRMDKATVFTFPGVPDFVIGRDGGKVLWIETKSRNGKQTPEQKGFQMMLDRNGHDYYLVRNYAHFLEIVTDKL